MTPALAAALWFQVLAGVFGELWKTLHFLMLFSGTPSKAKPLHLLFWPSDQSAAGVPLVLFFSCFFFLLRIFRA